MYSWTFSGKSGHTYLEEVDAFLHLVILPVRSLTKSCDFSPVEVVKIRWIRWGPIQPKQGSWTNDFLWCFPKFLGSGQKVPILSWKVNRFVASQKPWEKLRSSFSFRMMGARVPLLKMKTGEALRGKKQPTSTLLMDVSENRGTPKSSILLGFSIINHPFWGTPIFGNTLMVGGKRIPPRAVLLVGNRADPHGPKNWELGGPSSGGWMEFGSFRPWKASRDIIGIWGVSRMLNHDLLGSWITKNPYLKIFGLLWHSYFVGQRSQIIFGCLGGMRNARHHSIIPSHFPGSIGGLSMAFLQPTEKCLQLSLFRRAPGDLLTVEFSAWRWFLHPQKTEGWKLPQKLGGFVRVFPLEKPFSGEFSAVIVNSELPAWKTSFHFISTGHPGIRQGFGPIFRCFLC